MISYILVVLLSGFEKKTPEIRICLFTQGGGLASIWLIFTNKALIKSDLYRNTVEFSNLKL